MVVRWMKAAIRRLGVLVLFPLTVLAGIPWTLPWVVTGRDPLEMYFDFVEWVVDLA